MSDAAISIAVAFIGLCGGVVLTAGMIVGMEALKLRRQSRKAAK